MKKLFKAFSVLMAIVISIIPMSIATNAATTVVENQVDTSFEVTIPEYVQVTSNTEDPILYEIEAKNVVIPYGNNLYVRVETDEQLVHVKDEEVSLDYELYSNEQSIESKDIILTVPSGKTELATTSINAEVVSDVYYAGCYTDNITFNISVDGTTYLTPEEIESNPHVYAIGSTKPEYVIATFNEDYTSVVVSKNGDDSDGRMKGWTARESVFSLNAETLNTALVNEGVINIGLTAFYECENLITVELPESLTIIADSAFNRCHSLNNVYLSDNITSIGRSAFYECYSFTEVFLPDNLTKVQSSCFSRCKGLVTLVVGKNVESIGSSAFSECDLLANISLPNGLKTIGSWAFRYAYALESIVIPETVTSMESYAFGECKALKNINIPESITTISNSLFYMCRSLETIDIPSGVTSIGSGAFQHCTKLKTIQLPESLTTIGKYGLSDMTSIEEFSISENNEYFCIIDGVLYSKDTTKLCFYPLAKNVTSFTVPTHVTTLGTGCFGVHKYLKDIYVPETVTTVEEYTITNAYHPNLHTPVGSAFEQYCIESTRGYDNIMN